VTSLLIITASSGATVDVAPALHTSCS
jgi:hypothetical protein